MDKFFSIVGKLLFYIVSIAILCLLFYQGFICFIMNTCEYYIALQYFLFAILVSLLILIYPKVKNFKIDALVKEEYLLYAWIGFYTFLGFLIPIIILCTQTILEKMGAIVWFLGLTFLGGLTGLVFSIPKILSQPDLTLGRSSNTPTETALQENTNLFQISDWLTKIVIGAGLVQIKEIPKFVLDVGQRIGNGLIIKGNSYEGAKIFASGIIIFSVALGFVLGYIITRFVLNDLTKNKLIESQSKHISP